MRLSIWLMLFCWIPAACCDGYDRHPNIVIILADDLGYGDPGCYNDESLIPTPNIDQLANQGMRFLDAHTPSSVCTPTRYGLLTGRYCWRTRLKRSVLWPWDPPLLESERLTLPEMLQQQGYVTGCVGKWHLGWDWPLENGKYLTDEFQGFTLPAKQRAAWADRIDFSKPTRGGPTDHGFQHYFGDDVPNFPPYAFIENRQTVGLPSVSKPADYFGHPGPATPAWDLSLVMPRITQEAVDFIDHRQTDPEHPFFLLVTLTAPHTPIAPSPHFIGKSKAGWYGDYVHQVDWTVGQIHQALKRNHFTKDTLFIFTSDNGSPQRNGVNMNGPIGSVKEFGHDPSRPWRGMKSDAWEGGHRVPFVAVWPDHIKANATSGEPIILTDLMRTLAGLVDFQLDDKTAEDSFDIRPALFAKTDSKKEKPIHDHLVHHSGNGLFAIRQGPWKLILGRNSGGFTQYRPPADAPAGQLYNLESDPAEKNNVYNQHPDLVLKLTRRLDEIKTAGRSFGQ